MKSKFTMKDAIDALEAEGVPRRTLLKLEEYMLENITVWFAFRNSDRYSMGNAEFKVANNWISYLARVFMYKHPQHKGYFKTNPLRGVSS